ncbi:MAG: DnaJ domain-containing protein [Thermoflexibacteraceae bacterium]
MTDYYKILNVTFGASETEIKTQFRKLAIIYHPDKNGASKKSEETFKVILNAYEILSNKESRAIYDLKYKQYFQKHKSETTNQSSTSSDTKQEQSKQSPPNNKEYKQTGKTKSKINYIYWIIFILLILLYLYDTNKTTGNSKADQQTEEQKSENRPQSGEIDFNK